MIAMIKQWCQRHFSDPESGFLLFGVIVGLAIIVFLGKIFAPIFAAVVIAYLLDSIVVPMNRCWHVPRCIAVTLVYLFFIAVVVLAVVWLLPLLWKQFAQMITELPLMLASFHDFLKHLPDSYPTLLSHRTIHDLVSSTTFSSDKLTSIGKTVVSFSVASLPNLLALVVYIFLVPLLVLFFLKDKAKINCWLNQILPTSRGLMDKVGTEMRSQLGNYVRGKVVEIIIVGIVTYIGFWIFDLNYAPLLAFFVGLSVIIPYVGMVIVTIPVMVIGLLQFGPHATFIYMFVVYLVIQALDGNVLVPLLFSEAVNLHPVAIIAAVLFFGSIWGFWGLFFAIPLATLVKAVVGAWAKHTALPISP